MMELPQSLHFGTVQGGFLKTHNLLQPPEGEERKAPHKDNLLDIDLEKPQQAAQLPSAVEYQLPGGIGTFSISQRVPTPEENVFTVVPVNGNNRNEEISNYSSYTGSAFTLWEESAERKRNSGKEIMGDVNVLKESTEKEGQWAFDRPTQSSSDPSSSVSPLSFSQSLVQKNHSFMDMIKLAKGSHSIEESEDNLSLRRETSSSKTEKLRVTVDGKSCNHKANTPRPRHSATAQQRRCKINDRFQKLRGLIPHSDQKRDKASFLSEVIEHIQLLQEKVHRYVGSDHGWNNEPSKLIPWKNPADHEPRVVNSGASPMLMFGAKLDEKDAVVFSNILKNTQILAEPNVSNTIDFKMVDRQSEMAYKVVSSSLPLQPDVYATIGSSCAANQTSTRTLVSSLAQSRLWQNRRCTSEPAATANILKDQEVALQGGTISI